MQFFLNNKNSNICYSKLIEEYNSIFYDRRFSDVRQTIFYVNDRLKYILKKDFSKLNDNSLHIKLKQLKKYNEEYFIKENKFKGNMVTYFLCLIVENQKKINELKEYTIFISPISRFIDFFDEMISIMLQEHSILYNLDKKYFFNKNSYNYPKDILHYIKDKYIKKKKPHSIEKVKKNIEQILEKLSKEDNNNLKQNLNEPKIVINPRKALIDEKFDKIQFFYILDKNYVTNIKQEIMNCIFSF